MTHIPVLSHVPHGARSQVRDALSRVFQDFNFAKTEVQSCDSIKRLFAFAPCLLAAPPGNRRTSTQGRISLGRLVNQRVRLWNGEAYGELWQSALKSAAFRSAQAVTADQQGKTNAARATRPAKEGAYSRAAQALKSDGVHTATPAVAEELLLKHPQECPPTDGDFEAPHDASLPPLPQYHKFSETEVMGALLSFPKAVAAGGSAFSATHLTELLRVPCMKDRGLLSHLTEMVNTLAVGKAPESMSQWIASAPVTPLKKRDNGVRPIAVGETLRRLVGKVWMKRIKKKAVDILGDSQVGVATKGGSEALVHAVQSAVTKLGNDGKEFAVLQLDLKNAFNLVSRKAFLRVVRERMLELYKWVRYTYGYNKPVLWYGSVRWCSATGVQQGDPPGPLLFALALRLLMDDLEPKIRQWDAESGGDGLVMRAFYCDDGIFIAKHSILQRVLRYFQSPLAQSFGLHIHIDKCQVWWPCEPDPVDRQGNPPGVVQEYCTGTRVLQVPVGDLASIEAMVVEQVEQTQELFDAITELDDGHVAFFLLRFCFGSCRLAYILRCVPTEASIRSPRMYDKKLECTLRRLIGWIITARSFSRTPTPG